MQYFVLMIRNGINELIDDVRCIGHGQTEVVVPKPWRKIKKIRYSNTPEPIKGRQHMDIQVSVGVRKSMFKQYTYFDQDGRYIMVNYLVRKQDS